MEKTDVIKIALVLVVLVVASLSVVSTTGVLNIRKEVSGVGRVKVSPPSANNAGGNQKDSTLNIELFCSSSCTDAISAFNWGLIDPDSTTDYKIYVKNTGNVDVVLDFSSSGWTPDAAQQYIILTWDGSGATLGLGQVLETTMSLYVSPEIAGVESFSVDIVIYASQAF